MVIQLNEKMKKFTRQFPKLPTKIKLNKKKNPLPHLHTSPLKSHIKQLYTLINLQIEI